MSDNKYRRAQPDVSALLSRPSLREAYTQKVAAIEAAEIVREWRERAGLTQNQLAARMGVSQVRVSKVENATGRDGPTYGLMRRIAEACEVGSGPLTLGLRLWGQQRTSTLGARVPKEARQGVLTKQDVEIAKKLSAKARKRTFTIGSRLVLNTTNIADAFESKEPVGKIVAVQVEGPKGYVHTIPSAALKYDSRLKGFVIAKPLASSVLGPKPISRPKSPAKPNPAISGGRMASRTQKDQ
jgi:transcriptional regulator with XRE-family HTH domain